MVRRSIFVFGSNLAGRHGAGSALHAYRYHGALYGVAQGFQGDSYAIPTKDARLHSLPLPEIEKYVKKFIKAAKAHPELQFHVVAIGTGLAGYSHQDIAPMFKDVPSNCVLPVQWRRINARA